VETETNYQEICVNIYEDPYTPTDQVLRSSDLRDLNLRRQNVQAIKAIQSLIMKEEDTVMSQDEVLSRILDFYSRYVPFKAYNSQNN
jgi:hypothetical protein